jgi:hypothetical protein
MLSSVQTASSLIKNILDIIKETPAREDLIKLQNIILSLQEKNADLIEIKQKLEAKLVEHENWEKIAQNYSLAELAPGVFVYASNPDGQGGEPRHNVCTRCFQEKKAFPLNITRRNASGTVYTCPECKTEFIDHTKAFDVQLPPVFG